MASSQADRVPCWTLKPGLCMENASKIALGPLPPPPHPHSQVGAITAGFAWLLCPLIACSFVPRYSWDGGEVGIFSSREPPRISADSRDTLWPLPGFCIPVRSLRVSAFLQLSNLLSATCPPLPSTFGLWYAGATQVPSFRLPDPRGSLSHLSLYLVPASRVSPSAL